MHSTTNIKDGIAEFAVFNSPPREVISIRADCADRVDGLLAQFIGAKIENKDEVIHVTLWSDTNRRRKFKLYSACRLSELGMFAYEKIDLFAFKATDFDKLLGAFLAPLTEISTGYAEQASLVANMRLYGQVLDLGGAKATNGYLDSAVIETVEDVGHHKNAATDTKPDYSTARAVRLLVGWAGYEECLAAKHRPGPTRDNFLLLHNGVSDSLSFHVQFSELVPTLDPEDLSSDEDEREGVLQEQTPEP